MSIHTDKINAFKRELEECVNKRFRGDKSPDAQTVAITATAFVLKQLIAAARDDYQRTLFRAMAKEILDTD